MPTSATWRDGWLASPTDTIRCPAPRTRSSRVRSGNSCPRRPGGARPPTDGRTMPAGGARCSPPAFSTARQSSLSVVQTDRRFLNIAQHAVYVEPVHAARSRHATPPPLAVSAATTGRQVGLPRTQQAPSASLPLPSDHPQGTERRPSKRYRTRTHPLGARVSTTAAAAAVAASTDHDRRWFVLPITSSSFASCTVLQQFTWCAKFDSKQSLEQAVVSGCVVTRNNLLKGAGMELESFVDV